MSDSDYAEESAGLPTVAAKFVAYVLAFGVSVSVGLASFIGTKRVEFFSPLIDLIPATSQKALVPIVTLLMGLVAVAVTFYASGHTVASTRRRVLGRLLWACASLAVALYFIAWRSTTTVDAGSQSATFVVGLSHQPESTECRQRCKDLRPASCIKTARASQDDVSACYGVQVDIAEAATATIYLAVMVLFAALVGVLVAHEVAPKRKRQGQAQP